MNESLVPADHEIRILLTIKNGQVTERRLRDDELVATPAGFVKALRSVGKAHGLINAEKE